MTWSILTPFIAALISAIGAIYAILVSRRKLPAEIELIETTAAEKAVAIVEKAMLSQDKLIMQLRVDIEKLRLALETALLHVKNCEEALVSMRNLT